MISSLLERGEKARVFRTGVDPVELYITIAALGFFYLSNRHTLSTIFGRDLSEAKSIAARESTSSMSSSAISTCDQWRKSLLTHVPDMLENYYGPRALAEMRKLGEVRLNESGKVLGREGARRGREGLRYHRLRPPDAGPAEFFPLAPDCCAFLRVAVDIRNIDVEAASKQGVLVTHATPGFMASVSRDDDRLHDRSRARHHRRHDHRLSQGRRSRAAHGPPAQRRDRRHHGLRRDLAIPRADLRRTRHEGADQPIRSRRSRTCASIRCRSDTLLARVRFRRLPRGRQRADREPDERGELRAHEEDAPISSTLARQSGR